MTAQTCEQIEQHSCAQRDTYRVQLIKAGEVLLDELVKFKGSHPSKILIWKDTAFEKSHVKVTKLNNNKPVQTAVYYAASTSNLTSIVIPGAILES